jgi:hypothetical protein
MVFSFLGDRSGDRKGKTDGDKALARLRGPAEVRAYWEGLRRDGAIPARTDLDPRGMADVLDQVFVAERIGATRKASSSACWRSGAGRAWVW